MGCTIRLCWQDLLSSYKAFNSLISPCHSLQLFQSCLAHPNMFYRKVTIRRSAEGFQARAQTVVLAFSWRNVYCQSNQNDVSWEIIVWKVQHRRLFRATGGDLHEEPIWVFMSLQDIKRVHLTCTFLSSARALCSGAVGAARGTFGGCSTPQQQYASP